ncbi:MULTISPECIES: hypothetical protein [Mesorhizobium]|uniref:hypothetical protein n=1 Tax=Mesorhizobium australicum TaxID=536018 RepID=UPI00333CEF66
MVRRFEFVHPGEVERLGNSFPLWNGAPSLTYPIIIREELSTSMAGFVSARWGLVPGWGYRICSAKRLGQSQGRTWVAADIPIKPLQAEWRRGSS